MTPFFIRIYTVSVGRSLASAVVAISAFPLTGLLNQIVNPNAKLALGGHRLPPSHLALRRPLTARYTAD